MDNLDAQGRQIGAVIFGGIGFLAVLSEEKYRLGSVLIIGRQSGFRCRSPFGGFPEDWASYGRSGVDGRGDVATGTKKPKGEDFH